MTTTELILQTSAKGFKESVCFIHVLVVFLWDMTDLLHGVSELFCRVNRANLYLNILVVDEDNTFSFLFNHKILVAEVGEEKFKPAEERNSLGDFFIMLLSRMSLFIPDRYLSRSSVRTATSSSPYSNCAGSKLLRFNSEASNALYFEYTKCNRRK